MLGRRLHRAPAIAVLIGAQLLAACGGDQLDQTDQGPVGGGGDVVLRTDGVAIVDLGADPQSVIGTLTSRFGDPDRDSGWIDPTSAVYGSCPGPELRAVGWGSFFALFVGAGSGDQGSRWLTWTYGFDHAIALGGVDPRELRLRTDAGIGLGSTRRDLRSAHGDQLRETGDDLIDVWSFEIDDGAEARLRGALSGPGPDARVVFIERVPGCGDIQEDL